MEQRELPGASRPQQILDTIALGSILVFASVMPLLTPESTVADGKRGGREAANASAGEAERDAA